MCQKTHPLFCFSFSVIFVVYCQTGIFTAALGMDDGKFYYWQKKLKQSTSVYVSKSGGFFQMGKMPTTQSINI